MFNSIPIHINNLIDNAISMLMLAYDPISSQLLHILMVSLKFGETVPYIKILNKFDPTLLVNLLNISV